MWGLPSRLRLRHRQHRRSLVVERLLFLPAPRPESVDGRCTKWNSPSAGQNSFTLKVTDGGNGSIAIRHFHVEYLCCGRHVPSPEQQSDHQHDIRRPADSVAGHRRYAALSLLPLAWGYSVPGLPLQDGSLCQPAFPPPLAASEDFLGISTTPGNLPHIHSVTDSLGATFEPHDNCGRVSLLMLDQASLPKATVGAPYSTASRPSGGSGTYVLSSGVLPAGFSFTPANPRPERFFSIRLRKFYR